MKTEHNRREVEMDGGRLKLDEVVQLLSDNWQYDRHKTCDSTRSKVETATGTQRSHMYRQIDQSKGLIIGCSESSVVIGGEEKSFISELQRHCPPGTTSLT